MNYVIFGSRNAVLGEIGKRVMACGALGLVAGVVIGAWMRRRQWRRICKESARGERLNLIERIEKLEEDLKSSATIIRVLSRQLEKLGIRFRVTRKALKQPIDEVMLQSSVSFQRWFLLVTISVWKEITRENNSFSRMK